MNLRLSILANDSADSTDLAVVMESNDSSADQEVQAEVVDDSVAQTQAETASSGSGYGTIGMVIYIVALIAIFYFLAIRPSRKRDKELKEMQASIQVGDDVMTSSGFYGKVVEMNDQVVTVEFGTNRGVRIPVKKSEILGNKAPNVSSDEKK